MKRLSILVLFIALNLFFTCTQVQQASKEKSTREEPSLKLDDELPVDPNITKGTLDNGITYYIRTNHKPEDRAELRLAVNVGSVLEDEDQQGLAHFCEHMAFNGTKHFKKKELIDYLESLGMRFGADLNAYTSFDETVYKLQVPTDDAETLEKGFQILEDWAHNLSFDEDEIDKERGVIREEWRLGRGAQGRMRDKQFPILLYGSRYAERLPIGQIDVVDTCRYETLRRFYHDWYRPELMAVVVVGDFDKEKIKDLIIKYFSRIPASKNVRERKKYCVPDHDETLFAIATDPEATGSGVSVYYKHDVREEKTVSDYRNILMEGLYNGMLNNRLRELTKQAEPPFLYGYSTKGRFIRSKEFYVLGAVVEDKGVKRGLETLLTEALRVKTFGFTQSELDRSKTAMLRNIEKYYKEKDKTESSLHASEYIRNFLTGEPIPGIEYEFEVYKQYLPGISLVEVNGLVGEWITDKNRVILVNAPEKPDLEIPVEGELLNVFQAVQRELITPYEDKVSDEPLVDTSPSPAKIVSEKKIEPLDVTELVLSNGIKIILKPTDYKNDEVLLSSYSPGGNSLVEDDDYIAAVTAIPVITEGGIGNFNKIELDKKLADKLVVVRPNIRDTKEGISATASPEDMETMFQLIYLFFTAPRKDSSAFLSYKSRMMASLENKSARPENALSDTIKVTMAQYNYRARPWSPDLLEEMNLEKSLQIYRDRFADASDFTFFIVGNFNLQTIKPFIQTYLGGLPILNRNETWRDIGIDPPKGVIEKVVKKGIEQKSRVEIIFTGPFKWDRYARRDIRSMVDILRIKLRKEVREEKGGTYGVRIYASTYHHPDEEYKITIDFGCDPERVNELTNAVFEQIEDLRSEGPSEENMAKIKEIYRRKREKDLKSNKFWLSTLQFYYFHGEDPLNLLELDKLMEDLTPEEIQKAAQRYFNMDNYVKVVLLPEDM